MLSPTVPTYLTGTIITSVPFHCQIFGWALVAPSGRDPSPPAVSEQGLYRFFRNCCYPCRYAQIAIGLPREARWSKARPHSGPQRQPDGIRWDGCLNHVLCTSSSKRDRRPEFADRFLMLYLRGLSPGGCNRHRRLALAGRVAQSCFTRQTRRCLATESCSRLPCPSLPTGRCG